MDVSRGAPLPVLAMADPTSRMVVTRNTRDRKAFSGATSADTLQDAPPELTPNSWRFCRNFEDLRVPDCSCFSYVVSFCDMEVLEKVSDKGTDCCCDARLK